MLPFGCSSTPFPRSASHEVQSAHHARDSVNMRAIPTSAPSATPPLPPPLAARLRDGYGYILRSDIERLGFDPHVLRRWVTSGHLEALGHGEYVIATRVEPDPPTGGSSPFHAERIHHLRRCEAVLAGNPDLHLVGPSALLAHALPVLSIPERITVSGPTRRRPTRALLHARMPWGSEPMHGDRLRYQSAAEAVVEVSVMEGLRSGLVCADALAHRLGSTNSLNAALDAFGHRTGVRQARAVIGAVEPLTESPGESLTRLICRDAAIPLIPQVAIHDEAGHFVARVDFLVAATRVVIEFDGLSKYGRTEDLRAEKLRQLALERLGYRVIRFVWADLARPGFVVATVRSALHQAA